LKPAFGYLAYELGIGIVYDNVSPSFPPKLIKFVTKVKCALWLQLKRPISKTCPPNNETSIKITGKNCKPCHWGPEDQVKFLSWHLRVLQTNLWRLIASAGQKNKELCLWYFII